MGRTERVGVVAIGRNEGDRLRRCLESLVGRVAHVVYVDSGSDDGSVALAERLGVEVVQLDMTVPFTAARGRNAGFERLRALAPTLEFVQFVDGDCEIAPGWIERAIAEMEAQPSAVVVCGRRREQQPDATRYNRLMDMEWDTPIGVSDACGGDSLMRAAALEAVGGFNPTMIAGEEPELCVRLRRNGGTVHRIDADMTFHDAAMTTFGQWWQRMVRNGYAFALGAGMHGAGPERHWVADRRRILQWGALVPLALLMLLPVTRGISVLGFALYPVWALRIAQGRMRDRGDPPPHALLYGVYCMIGKFPQMIGLLRYQRQRLRGETAFLIEYK